MILGFKQTIGKKKSNFPNKIERGVKIHSMRMDPKKRWRVGMKIQLAYYEAKMKYQLIKEVEVVSIQDVVIKWYEESCAPVVKIDGRTLWIAEIIVLSLNDGFDNVKDFYNYFNMSGVFRLIHWTSFAYDGDSSIITWRVNELQGMGFTVFESRRKNND